MCQYNKIRSLPGLPTKLFILSCSNNQITSLPDLPDALDYIYTHSNPITEFIGTSYSYLEEKQSIKKLNKFRWLYYSLKIKEWLRKLLWERVRKPKIQEHYHPRYLLENLQDEEADLDAVLSAW